MPRCEFWASRKVESLVIATPQYSAGAKAVILSPSSAQLNVSVSKSIKSSNGKLSISQRKAIDILVFLLTPMSVQKRSKVGMTAKVSRAARSSGQYMYTVLESVKRDSSPTSESVSLCIYKSCLNMIQFSDDNLRNKR